MRRHFGALWSRNSLATAGEAKRRKVCVDGVVSASGDRVLKRKSRVISTKECERADVGEQLSDWPKGSRDSKFVKK